LRLDTDIANDNNKTFRAEKYFSPGNKFIETEITEGTSNRKENFLFNLFDHSGEYNDLSMLAATNNSERVKALKNLIDMSPKILVKVKYF
jgi:hypothetical protein